VSGALVVSKRAEADLMEIWLWTYKQFGEAQADHYLDKLDAGMTACGTNPESGRTREELRSGYRSLAIGKHVVFYTVTGSEVVVQRVLHSSMDLGTHLLESDD
jgi:toxin ParE1/3/4